MRRYVELGETKTTSSTHPESGAFSDIRRALMSRKCLQIVKFEKFWAPAQRFANSLARFSFTQPEPGCCKWPAMST